ncbi:hypothetical protein B0H16DRAFT_1463041 [Mycena metata]|uniref:Uncharacterized protein n=1 Tax=Mycena metata TaxID=1033252 RepID=A0AAD7IJX9_9AGAR|nr:hypothetical protein B0H16DRAFT_1463041 [Mycena metata]
MEERQSARREKQRKARDDTNLLQLTPILNTLHVLPVKINRQLRIPIIPDARLARKQRKGKDGKNREREARYTDPERERERKSTEHCVRHTPAPESIAQLSTELCPPRTRPGASKGRVAVAPRCIYALEILTQDLAIPKLKISGAPPKPTLARKLGKKIGRNIVNSQHMRAEARSCMQVRPHTPMGRQESRKHDPSLTSNPQGRPHFGGRDLPAPSRPKKLRTREPDGGYASEFTTLRSRESARESGCTRRRRIPSAWVDGHEGRMWVRAGKQDRGDGLREKDVLRVNAYLRKEPNYAGIDPVCEGPENTVDAVREKEVWCDTAPNRASMKLCGKEHDVERARP